LFQSAADGLIEELPDRPTPRSSRRAYRAMSEDRALSQATKILLQYRCAQKSITIGRGTLALKMGSRASLRKPALANMAWLPPYRCASRARMRVYMGTEDMARQALNVAAHAPAWARKSSLVDSAAHLKDAINEAMPDWVTNVAHHALSACSV